MSSTTPNIGMTKTTASETIGQNWAANNETGGNLDILDTKIGPVGNTSVQAQLDALNSKLVDVQSNRLTAGTNVTIDMQRSIHLGKIAVYNLVVSLSATKTRNAQVVSGLGEHNGGFNGVPTIVATDNNGNFAHFMLADGGVIIAAEDIPAGRWRMAFCYILN